MTIMNTTPDIIEINPASGSPVKTNRSNLIRHIMDKKEKKKPIADHCRKYARDTLTKKLKQKLSTLAGLKQDAVKQKSNEYVRLLSFAQNVVLECEQAIFMHSNANLAMYRAKIKRVSAKIVDKRNESFFRQLLHNRIDVDKLAAFLSHAQIKKCTSQMSQLKTPTNETEIRDSIQSRMDTEHTLGDEKKPNSLLYVEIRELLDSLVRNTHLYEHDMYRKGMILFLINHKTLPTLSDDERIQLRDEFHVKLPDLSLIVMWSSQNRRQFCGFESFSGVFHASMLLLRIQLEKINKSK